MTKVVDISILLAEYQKAKIAHKTAETAFDAAQEPHVTEMYDAFEKAEDDMNNIACQIVETLIEGM